VNRSLLGETTKLLQKLRLAKAEGDITPSPTFGTHNDDHTEEILRGKVGFAVAVGRATERSKIVVNELENFGHRQKLCVDPFVVIVIIFDNGQFVLVVRLKEKRQKGFGFFTHR
jgi:hypothetical protein